MSESAQGELREILKEAMEKWHRCMFCNLPMSEWGRKPLCWWPDGDGHSLGNKPQVLVENGV